MNTTLENAIVSEIATASGLAKDGLNARIVFEHQSREPLPSGDLITVRFDAVKQLAPATPEQSIRDNPSPSPGEEILLGVFAQVEFVVRLTYYAASMSGSNSAYSKLNTLTRKLYLDSVGVRLEFAGVVLVECGDVRSLPVVLETRYESRAICDLRFRTRDGVEVPETFIETTEVVVTYT